MRQQISLYGDDAEQFTDIKQAVTEYRDGNEPSNAEVLRLMMQEFTAPAQASGNSRAGLV